MPPLKRLNERREIRRGNRRFKRRRLIVGFCVLVFLLSLIIAGLVFALRAGRWLIQQVIVTGNAAVSGQTVEEAVRPLLQGNYWLVLPRRSVFLYPRQEIVNVLKNNFPVIKEAAVSLLNGQTLLVEVTERRAEFLWCHLLQDEDTAPSFCYLSDASGLIFAVAPELTGEFFLEIVTPLTESPVNTHPLPEPDFLKLIALARELDNWFGVMFKVFDRPHPPKIYRLVQSAKSEFAFWLKGGGKILVNLSLGSEQVLANLRAAFTVKELQTLFLEQPERLDYLDLRFPPKVFYKIRQ